ncbi:extracellular solute-binding protein [Granulicoccus phenolivorans]|uniref:extracellular solute-binding protein n=1 Tax=Granulicoccus phenolivorans TaxID=266854 RepID=UPI0005507630|nr:extracellular solute-binding protein [Granulicoccus phenolivorans]
MRRWLAAGVAVATAGLLAACSATNTGPPTLTWYINPDDGGQVDIAAKCTQASGGTYRIQTSLLPRDAASQREQLARRLAAGDSSLDIMSLDPPYVPELAEPGFLAPVPQTVIDQRTTDVVDGARKGAQWNGKYVVIPFWANTQLLWYRKSVVEKAGLDMSKPVTWDQIMNVARQTGTHLGVQGIRGESMTVWVNALMESQGQSIVIGNASSADQTQFGLDSPQGVKAAEIIGTIGREGLGGPGLTTQDENQSMSTFQGAKGSFMVNWPFVWPATQSAKPELISDIGWTTYPRVDANTESAPPLGGIMLGVGAKSKHTDLAFEAVTCITSPENQAHYFVTNGNPPASKAAYDDPQVAQKFPMAPVIRTSLDNAKPRPQTPYYNEVSTGLQQRWTPVQTVTDQTPAQTQQFLMQVLRGERLL